MTFILPLVKKKKKNVGFFNEKIGIINKWKLHIFIEPSWKLRKVFFSKIAWRNLTYHTMLYRSDTHEWESWTFIHQFVYGCRFNIPFKKNFLKFKSTKFFAISVHTFVCIPPSPILIMLWCCVWRWLGQLQLNYLAFLWPSELCQSQCASAWRTHCN